MSRTYHLLMGVEPKVFFGIVEISQVEHPHMSPLAIKQLQFFKVFSFELLNSKPIDKFIPQPICVFCTRFLGYQDQTKKKLIQKDRKTERQKDKEDRKSERQKDRKTERQKDRKT